MKTLEIVGRNYSGSWNRTRVACRGLVLRDVMLLLSYETRSGLWMIPGGGLESGEDESACCIREVAEETGFVIEPSPCALEITEYYGSWRFLSRYFFGTVVGQCERKLTDREARAGMEPRWIPLEDAAAIFSQHAAYEGVNEMRRGLYQREYAALCSLFDVEPHSIEIKRRSSVEDEP